ncbi:MAG: shikimate dehydrogenase [Melioribacteraceae bacterium]|nr:shikimate dehydrogenase [Melioribacteraceae bacterium]MCF8263826.1 shikimate dehydrogenase [Melioribacteraceae bacterium]MCF8412507.1 shikimate dehydrogenase [Melioribacteraceae bacterium]
MKPFNKFNHNTKIVGVIGRPIKHSFSPLMHNISFELAGLNYIYLPFDLPGESLKSAIKGMVSLGFKGFNVTIPHKEKIIDYVNDLSEEAGVVGAVNTVVIEENKLKGFNTDIHGIVQTLEPVRDDINNKTVTVIGAGGGARSVLYALIRHFKVDKINIINRTVGRAESLKEYFSVKMHFENFETFELIPPDITGILQNSKLIINTTSIGLSPDIDDAPTTIADCFHKDQIVFDLIYNPLETKLLKIAKSKGARTLDGLGMFIDQGAKAYELWTGEEMPREKIYKTLVSYLSE